MKAQQARVSVTKSESLVRKTYENSITCELPNKGFTADVLRLNIFFLNKGWWGYIRVYYIIKIVILLGNEIKI